MDQDEKEEMHCVEVPVTDFFKLIIFPDSGFYLFGGRELASLAKKN